MNEKAYLADFDPREYPPVLVMVDAALFTFHEQQLLILLVKRSNHPDMGKWSLPGGFVDPVRDKSLEDAANRKLLEKTGVTPPYVEQLLTIGNDGRDKRGWSVTVCYTALIAHQKCAPGIDTVSDARWVPVDVLDEVDLAFDHRFIITQARDRLKQKALYSIVPAYALPEKFTLPELQRIHEVLIGKPLQKKSFRRRIEQAELLLDTGLKRQEGGRPAALYKMRARSGRFTFVRNLEE
ncbi:MAG TPA: NUDIX domain-containing protein [Steroidobacteraceae bacterium]|jgi:ADP-ribose pyrophosphatase YjhB (NUDIX family)|nr:NUDIX domain-containing protein [Steroidobacteraceae bacterium]